MEGTAHAEPLRPQDGEGLHKRRFPDAGYITAAITLLGGFLYVALRLAYSVYYGVLYLTPDDVGLGYAQILVQGLPALVTVLLVVWLSAFFMRFSFSWIGFVRRLRVLRVPPTPHDQELARLLGESPRQVAAYRALYPRATDVLLDHATRPNNGTTSQSTLRRDLSRAQLMDTVAMYGLDAALRAATRPLAFMIVSLAALVTLPLGAWYAAEVIETGSDPNAVLSQAIGLRATRAEVLPLSQSVLLPEGAANCEDAFFVGAHASVVWLYCADGAGSTYRFASTDVTLRFMRGE